jgi:hypothetical protein
VLLVDHDTAETIVRPETNEEKHNYKGVIYVITIRRSLQFRSKRVNSEYVLLMNYNNLINLFESFLITRILKTGRLINNNNNVNKKLRGLNPRANYSGRATAAYRRN